jgi:hypothetical protein
MEYINEKEICKDKREFEIKLCEIIEIKDFSYMLSD